MRLISRTVKGFTLIELMIVVAIIGILAAIAIPNFMKFQARSKQSEAKTNLKGIYTAEKSFYQEHDSYNPWLSMVGFAPERGNRYYYTLGGTAPQNRASAALPSGSYDAVAADIFRYGTSTSATYATSGGATMALVADPGHTSNLGNARASVVPNAQGDFVASAAGDIDSERDGIDVWSISSQSGTLTSSMCSQPETNLAEGQPILLYNDVSCD